jgi:starvation-inducible DNA-binding protein
MATESITTAEKTSSDVNVNVTQFDQEQRRGLQVATARRMATGLADSYAAMLATQNYHWNVEGPLFKQLHELFEEQYRAMFEAVDTIAERLRAVGFYAPGTFSEFQKITTIPDVVSTQDGETMVLNLVRIHQAVVETFKGVSQMAQHAGDIGTEDLAVARIREHEKFIWMLKSTLGGQSRMDTRPN